MQYTQLQTDPWEQCRIDPRDGSPAALMVLDMNPLRAADIAELLEARCRLARRNQDPECEKCRLDLWEPARQLARAESSNLAVVACFEHKPIHFYFRRSAGKLDLEVFFWPDLMLADGDDEEGRGIFRRLVQLALDICEHGEGRAVLMSTQWHEDPLTLEAREANVLWKRE